MKAAIIGRGNVASHLQKALEGKATTCLINPHTLDGIHEDTEVIIISVPDNAIIQVASMLKRKYRIGHKILAHTSGSTSISALEGFAEHTGVFYPLQTFSRNVPLEYDEIPFFIEASDSGTGSTLKDIACLISKHVYYADSDKRRKLHVASVFGCNFVNHLWALTEKLLTENGLDFGMLHPLIKETCRKALSNSPAEVQTGPAIRHDTCTISAHLEMLNNNPELQHIYGMLSESIKKMQRNY